MADLRTRSLAPADRPQAVTRRLLSSTWRENRLWKGYALTALPLGVVYFLLGGETDAQVAIYQAFIMAAPIAILVGVWRHRPARPLPWLLFAGGLALWCVGDGYWNTYLWILHKQAPYPSFADFAYLAAYPFLIAGAFIWAQGWGRSRVGNILDAAIIALAAASVSTLFLLKPMLATSTPAFAKVIAVGFPVMDFVILLAFMQLLLRRRVMNFALRAILLGTGALVVVDSVYSYLGLTGSYTTGMIIDAGWLACYALWPIAALHPSMARIRSLPEQEGVGLSFWRIGALVLAMLAAPIVLIVETLGKSTSTDEIGLIIVVTTLLVGARVWLFQRDGKKGQTALIQSEERLRLAHQVAGVSTWDVNLASGKPTVSGPLAATISGSADAEVTSEAWTDFVHPDDRERVLAAFDLAVEASGDFEQEYRFRSPNGEEGWLLSRGRVFLKDARAVGVAVDITHRHEMEEQLKRNEERMRMAQELGGIGTWNADLQTGETTWSENLRRISGVDDDAEASHELFMTFVHPDDRAELEAAMSAAGDNGGRGEFEYRIVRPNDGEVRWMLSRGDVVTGSDGQHFLGVAVDITERRLAEEHQAKLEQQLRQAHKLEAVGRLAGGVAHDFNNILLAIRGNGELALDALKHGANATEEVEEMVAAADRAAALTAQLLAYSRRQVLQAEVLDLNEVVRDMDKLLRRMIGEDVELHAVVAEKPVDISADRSQIEQVIANLVVNARDAMPDGGLLTVEVSTAKIGSEHGIDLPPGRYAKLTVNDTGSGMDSETVAKVFEPFFTTKPEGTGFGLSTVHGIVVQTGGSIWVYSEVDHGTTFKIFLPLAEQAQALEAELPDRPTGSTEKAGETILLVEDDPHVQRIVRNILSRAGYRVLSADGAAEALRLAEEEGDTIHLLLSDLVMPGTSGRELAVQIQALRPAISVLYMSGYTDDAVIRRGVLEAGTAFIQKPFGAEDLAHRVREVLDSQAVAA
jgi:two-component system cell cycle sensor histidine kinase/response regulator CckA